MFDLNLELRQYRTVYAQTKHALLGATDGMYSFFNFDCNAMYCKNVVYMRNLLLDRKLQHQQKPSHTIHTIQT